MNTNPKDEKPYSEEASKARELRSSLQSMRDRLMAVLPQKFGDAFDGDMDTLLEAANYLGRAALRTASQPATPASASEVDQIPSAEKWLSENATVASVEWKCGWDACRVEYPVRTLHQPPSGEWVMVPVNPTEEQWGGLARDIVMWMQAYHPHTGAYLFKHLERSGRDIPKWLYEEVENTDFAPPKGTIAAIIYRAMIEAATPADGTS